LAWLGLVIASIPLAATFAALGARHPDSGGVSTYARRAFGGGKPTVYATAVALFAAVGITNYFGVRISGRVQLALAGVLVLLLAVAAIASLPHAHLSNLRPFAPHGWLAIAAASILVLGASAGDTDAPLAELLPWPPS
jgi:amino acid efflux transporter